MNLSKRWLHDYVNLDVSDQQFADDMTLSGSKVESFETEGADIKNVIVGKVVSLVKHPDSDHLWICQIDVGAKDNIQIVTGAQNLKVNDVVPVAMDDSFVSGGHHIKRASSAELSQTVCSAHSVSSDLRFMIFRMRLRTVFSFSAMIATKLSARIYTRQ